MIEHHGYSHTTQCMACLALAELVLAGQRVALHPLGEKLYIRGSRISRSPFQSLYSLHTSSLGCGRSNGLWSQERV